MPKLSVIVISYNNELYIEEALTSLNQQTYDDFEVIVVNDASTDKTKNIIEGYIKEKSRFKLINLEENSGGCSVPRNVGIEESKGKYVMFLDGDDWYTKNACELMVNAIEKYDSDFVAGEVVRTNNYQTWYKNMIFNEPRINFHAREFTNVLYDSLSVNKIYKREFLDKHQLRFPEGMHYEDIVFTGKAYFLSEKISTICEPIYYWRVVENAKEKSITNRRNEIDNLLNRLRAHRIYDQFLIERNELTSIQKKNLKFLRHDLVLYLRDYKKNILKYDKQFKKTFKKALHAYIDETIEVKELAHADEETRIGAYLLKKKRFDEFEAYMLYLNKKPQQLVTVRYDANIFYIYFPKLNLKEKWYMKIQKPQSKILINDLSIEKGEIKLKCQFDYLFSLPKEEFSYEIYVRSNADGKSYEMKVEGNKWSIKTKDLPIGKYQIVVQLRLFGYPYTEVVQSKDTKNFQFISKKQNSGFIETYIEPNGAVGFKVREKKLLINLKNHSSEAVSSLNKKFLEKTKELAKSVIYNMPVKKKWIYFESNMGKQYSDNPKYIFEEMINQKKNYTYIWGFIDPNDADVPFTNVKKVKKGTLKHFYYQARAKYWFDNQGIGHIVEKKQNQIYTQTWHGTPLKKMGFDIIPKESPEAKRLMSQVKQWDYFISPNEYSSTIFKNAFDIEAEILTIGYPRNDVLINEQNKIKQKVKEKLKIKHNKKILLYAPTFRDWNSNAYLKIYRDVLEMTKKMPSDYLILLRLHYLDDEKMKKLWLPKNIINVTNYMDIQELYCISDVLITDYSSVMFDYACLKKPIYFYCYDMNLYKEKRGTYFDISNLPGSVSHTLDDLMKNIKEGTLKKEQYEAFYQKFCLEEKGTASANVIQTLQL